MPISAVLFKANQQATPETWMDSRSATAQAADITAPKTAMLADGVLTTGTGSGGGGGLEYETGTYTPASDTDRPTISFAKTHTVPPAFVTMSDISEPSTITSNSGVTFNIVDSYRLAGTGWPYNTSSLRYGIASYAYISTSTASTGATAVTNNSDNPGSNSGYYRYYATETNFMPYCNNTSRLWRAGRTYKWIAVWGPTT